MNLIKIKPQNCIKCKKPVQIHGGPEEWKPTFSDPDSGGVPYFIECSCGLSFKIGCCDYLDFVKEWNNSLNNYKQFKIELIEDYDGFIYVCEGSIKDMKDLTSYHDKYKNKSNYNCDYEDDGHCLYINEKKECQNCVKIGYIKYNNDFYYPLIGDNIIIIGDELKIVK